jgi:hypothetical protein
LVTIFEATAIISATSAIFVIIFTIIQLRHIEKHRNVDVTLKLFEWAESERLRKALWWLEKEYNFKSYADYKVAEEENIEANEYPFEIVTFYEQIGFLVKKNFVDLEVISDRMGRFVLTNWRKLEPWIEGVRQEKHDPTYGEHFQNLYLLTLKYFQKQCASGQTNFCVNLETA